jgi:hypothetical protein
MVLYEKCGSELREETGDPTSTAKHAHDPRSLLEETELEILQTQARLQQLVQKRVSSKKEVNDRSSSTSTSYRIIHENTFRLPS